MKRFICAGLFLLLAEVSAAQGVSDAPGPVAIGVIGRDGMRRSGSYNWSAAYNTASRRYEVQISGEGYYYLRYATLITPMADGVVCVSSSVGGKLLIRCYDRNGTPTQTPFGFVTFKPSTETSPKRSQTGADPQHMAGVEVGLPRPVVLDVTDGDA